MNNIKNYYGIINFLFLFIVLVLFLSGCPGPWKGEDAAGIFYIGSWDGNERTVSAANTGELANVSVQVTLTSPGRTVKKTFGPEGGKVELAVGIWQLEVKAYNNEPRLRGLADEILDVRSGGKYTVTINPCIGIRNEAELSSALSSSGISGIGHDTTSGKGDLLVLENSIALSSQIAPGSGLPPVTIIAEPGTFRTIAFSSPSINLLTNTNTFTFGRTGEDGGLIIRGFYDGGSDSAINVSSGGTVIFYGNTEINGHVRNSGGGGGVYVSSNGAFYMNDNSRIINCKSGSGGGVYVNGGAFTLENGTITGNIADTYGGGVYIDAGGSFTMKNGSIIGNGKINGDPPYNASISASPSAGGGVYITDSGSSFTMRGGFITNNVSTNYSGGVFVENSGAFYLYSPAAKANISGNGDSYGDYAPLSSQVARNSGDVYIDGIPQASAPVVW